ncbi:unnamed protein product [Ranitomeya imitator]|uniref:Helix-turn-helix domain-containing protein n=1 Tax=Ranitomeya imitator TaxID=111125 RepID=A0ABN9KQJ8_9NEOB|nr:unnamed protein product [Ranitomeya imitator]
MGINQINLCVDLLTLVLFNNFFLFHDQFFLQTHGTAMASNVAPPYANAYMTHFEESVIYKHPLFISNVFYWTRYIDDVFCLWGGTLESLQSFFEFLNGAWPGIQFTMTMMLDTVVLKDEGGHLTSDLHIKPTDRNSILHSGSFHPQAVKRSIPGSQYQHVNRIVSNSTTRDQCLQDMTSNFLLRGYPKRVLNEQIDHHPRTRPQNLRDNLVKADIGPTQSKKNLIPITTQNGHVPLPTLCAVRQCTKG